MQLATVRQGALAIAMAHLVASCGSDSSPMQPPGQDPPSSPAGVQVVTVGDGSVTLSWNAVSGATSYTVYLASQAGVTRTNYMTQADGARRTNVTSPAVISGLVNERTYYFVVTASNSGGESTESAEVSATPEAILAPQADLQLPGGNYLYTSVDIPAGTTVTVSGPVVITVTGDATINGTLIGDCQDIEIRVVGDFTLDGLLSNRCDAIIVEPGTEPGIKVVVDGDLTVGTAPSNEDAIVSDGLIRITDTSTEDEDFEIEFDVEASPPRGTAGRGAARQAGGGGGTINSPITGGEVRLSTSGSLTIAADFTMNDGADVPAKTDSPTCDNTAMTGEKGGDIRLFARGGTLTIADGTKLQAGNGGKGGDCTATGDPAVALAGNGGTGGGVYFGGQGLTIGANVTVVRGNGGAGGNARAEGDHADEPCEDGAAATATGGMGGRMGGAGYISAAPVTQGAAMEDGGNGGSGGSAYAKGGDGAACVCGMGDGAGGDGGDGTATGGDGGHGARAGLFPIVAGSHKKGDGGDAEALGGFGGAGPDCCGPPPMPGGDGGKGGNATATGGSKSVRGITDGQDGKATTFGGDGGEGGDGNGPGMGGDGGTATSTGRAPEENPGTDGLDGEPCKSGTYNIGLSVVADPGGHLPFLGLPLGGSFNITVTDPPAPNIAEGTIVIEGPSGWPALEGQWNPGTQEIWLGGTATLGGGSYPDIQFDMHGILSCEGLIFGDLTLSNFPASNPAPISFAFSGVQSSVSTSSPAGLGVGPRSQSECVPPPE